MELVKEWMQSHTKVTIVIISIFCLIVVASVARCSVVQGDKITQEDIAKEHKTVFTESQQRLYDDYKTSYSEIIQVLENSKWTDNSGQKALFMSDKDIIERYHDTESIESYAICSMTENKDRLSTSLVQHEYRMTVLTSKNEYKNLTLTKTLDSEKSDSAVVSANLKSDDLFVNATVYNRVSNVDDFNINNWDDNANQFVEGKYNELYGCIKMYCSKYYPQVSSVDWTGLVTVDYQGKTVTYTFTIKTTSYYTLNVVYYQGNSSFECVRSKSF